MTTTLIVGCGYLGRRVAARLIARGGAVFGTTRSAGNAEALRALGIVPVLADLTGPAPLELPRTDRVFHCVGYDRSSGASYRAVYVDGLARVLEAVRSGGHSPRFVSAGSTSVYGQNGGEWVDEDAPTEPATESGRVGLEAEGLIREAGGVVVRFSGLYGPDRMIRRGALERGEPIPAEPSKYLNLIQIDDAAAAAVAALAAGTPGRVYLASDDRPVHRSEYYGLASRLLGAPPPRFEPPPPGTPGTRDDANKRVSNRRIKAELGLVLAFPTIETGLPASLSSPAS